MTFPAGQKPKESGGDVSWVQLMRQMLLPWSRDTKYECASAAANRDVCTSSTWKQPHKHSRVSLLVSALCTIQLFKFTSFKYGKMCISANPLTYPYVCVHVHVRAACTVAVHPVECPTQMEQLFSLSMCPCLAPSPAMCTHHCTHHSPAHVGPHPRD